MVQGVEWGDDARHKVQFYALPVDEPTNQEPPFSSEENEGDWFDFNRWSDASGRGRTDTPLRELDFESSASANSATEARFAGSV